MENNNECFICMETTEQPVMDINLYDTVRTCHCNGFIHGECYSNWLSIHKSCPVCRNTITSINHIPIAQIVPFPRCEELAIDRLPDYSQDELYSSEKVISVLIFLFTVPLVIFCIYSLYE